MRTSIFILMILFAVAGTSGFAQTIQIPKATTDAFSKEFPKAQKPHWQKGKFGFGYNVTFIDDTLKNSAFYDQFGQLYKHTIFLSAELLPEAVRITLSTQHPHAKIGPVRWVRNMEGTFYSIELLKDGRSFEVQLDEEGQLFDETNGEDVPMVAE